MAADRIRVCPTADSVLQERQSVFYINMPGLRLQYMCIPKVSDSAEMVKGRIKFSRINTISVPCKNAWTKSDFDTCAC